MELLMTQNFNGVNFNCYRAENESDEFFATREQIGQLLGYENPRKAIAIIHTRNKERLDKFSKGVQIETPSRGAQSMTVYSFRGLLEICRYSNQPKADAVMDFLYDIADKIRKYGFYATPATAEKILNDPDTFIKILQEYKLLRYTNFALQKQLKDNRPKVVFADAVGASSDSILVGELAVLLNQNGINVGQNRLFAWLRENGYLIKARSERYNLPTQRSIDNGWLEIKERFIGEPSKGFIRSTPKVTGKGQMYFINGFLEGKFKI